MTVSESPMASDFFLDSPVPPKLDLTGARSRFYRSPRTPSATSSLCRSVTSPAHFSSRKRARYGYNDFDSHQKIGSFESRVAWPDDQPAAFGDPASPAPLVSTDYRLADGGLEPSSLSLGPASTAFEHDDNGAEIDYRPSRYSVYPILSGEVNRRKRERPASSGDDMEHHAVTPSSTSIGWGRAVINLVGGVAGRVWDFCWTGAFRGFYAGGGRGYDLNAPDTDQPTAPSFDNSSWEKMGRAGQHLKSASSRINTPTAFDRQKMDEDWVLVKNEKDQNESPSYIPRKIPRRGGGPSHHISPRRPIARAIPKRPSLIPVRPGSLYTQTQSSLPLPTSSPASHSRPKTPKDSSPLALDAQRYAAKIRRREKEEDASIRRLNQQLKAMIREGKQALETKVEVEIDTMDMDY
ncbi:hypothetical protein LOZ53_002007 [Ophidiomyces ophidiicola]|uniref:Uncharacterized protein n=1 Tax=Ophidiomyces ophidiicola TaxID=1387563 RepID=A0ACB8UQD4_9EURO|nr:hypothetical protein LOZ62_005132 [Ophidiomyces ophidiicola]KAI1969810.1 hypothetical protein LOZ56_004145 [Ophidiomyces ophidiicola]KAI1980123.1 hypothetical protein LOZ55_001524 [Ophidiomyces ophidiicola]KAI1993870.1 hypothetical protein LOZ54_001222 [Ophidiomyces ophidiicola]KAI1993950.1 hypothetical protein LOZ53_002007 [Ophidiomyces ophidiicola]